MEFKNGNHIKPTPPKVHVTVLTLLTKGPPRIGDRPKTGDHAYFAYQGSHFIKNIKTRTNLGFKNGHHVYITPSAQQQVTMLTLLAKGPQE